MGLEVIKEELHLHIEQADERFLRAMHALAKTYVDDKPDYFDFSAEAYAKSLKRPMTQEELVARALASEEDIKAGRVHDIDEVKAALGL